MRDTIELDMILKVQSVDFSPLSQVARITFESMSGPIADFRLTVPWGFQPLPYSGQYFRFEGSNLVRVPNLVIHVLRERGELRE